MLHGLAQGERDAAVLAAMADPGLRATPEQLQDTLTAAASLRLMHREMLGLFLARLELIETQIEILGGRIATHCAATRRKCSGWPRCPRFQNLRERFSAVRTRFPAGRAG